MPTSFYLFHNATRGTGNLAPTVNLDNFEPSVSHKSGMKVIDPYTTIYCRVTREIASNC